MIYKSGLKIDRYVLETSLSQKGGTASVYLAHLEQAVKNKVVLHISGHTHHGQLWPFNYITEKIYEISRGYEKREDTHLFISNGVGTWGPPMRLGNRPEIVNIKVKFLE